MSQTPITIHIPPQLRDNAIPLSKWLDQHPDYSGLATGAFIFAPAHLSSPPAPKLLLVQRAAAERSFANLFEIPGGAADLTDPTILHSVAREVFEETGLHLTRLTRQVGDGLSLTFKSGKPWMKLSFEIEVQEIGGGDGSQLRTLSDIQVTLDPREHQAFRWVTEDEAKDAVCFLKEGEGGRDRNMADIAQLEGELRLTSEDQKRVILLAFARQNSH